MRPRLEISGIIDALARKNFEKLRDFILAETPLDGFRGYEITFTKPVTGFKFKHTLGFQPKDIIQTSIVGQGSVQYNYSQFTANELDITVSGAVTSSNPTTIRFLAGTMEVRS